MSLSPPLIVLISFLPLLLQPFTSPGPLEDSHRRPPMVLIDRSGPLGVSILLAQLILLFLYLYDSRLLRTPLVLTVWHNDK
jgi:hypothetical protein